MRLYVKQYMEKKNIEPDLLLLLVIGGLYALGISLSNTFVNVYLWRQSENYLTIAVYNFAICFVQMFTFIVAGKWIKRIDRVIVLRLGVTVLALFFICVLMLGKQAPVYNMLLGGLLGAGYGLYWLAFGVLTFEITEPGTRDFFNGSLGILESFGGMAGPLVAGYVISRMSDFNGYTAIFILSFLLFLCAVISSFFLKRRQAEGKYYFWHVLKERSRDRNWHRILIAHFLQGLREGIFFFIITIWIFLVTNSELGLGMFNLLLSGMSLIVYFAAARWIKTNWRKKAIFIGGLLLYVSTFLIIDPAGRTHVYVYGVLIGLAFPLLRVPFSSLTFDVIGQAKQIAERRVEYIVARELYANMGRLLSIAVFIVSVLLFEPDQFIPILMIVFGSGHFFIYFAIRNIHVKPAMGIGNAKKDMALDEKNR